jgi:acyl carrier protein
MAELSMDELERRVIQVTMEVLSLDGPAPPRDARIVEDLGADSIDQFSLVSALECEFGGSIEEEDMEGLHTLGDVVHFIHAAARQRSDAGSAAQG